MNAFQHTALFSCKTSRFPTSDWAPCITYEEPLSLACGSSLQAYALIKFIFNFFVAYYILYLIVSLTCNMLKDLQLLHVLYYGILK